MDRASPVVSLRPLRIGDAVDIAKLYEDPEFTEYLPGEPDRIGASVRSWLVQVEMGRELHYTIRNAEGRFVGIVSITDDGDEDGEWQLTVGVAKEFRRHGFGRAAVAKSIEIVSADARINRLVGIARQDNTPSIHLSRKFDPNPTIWNDRKLVNPGVVSTHEFVLFQR